MSERFDRLPKWAQGEIQRLRADLENYKAQVAVLDTGEGDVIIDPYAHFRKEGTSLRFPRTMDVAFQIDGNSSYGRINLRIDDKNRLRIQAGRGVRILPCASNSFEIELSDDY